MELNDIIFTPLSVTELEDIFRKVIQEELNKKKEKELLSFRETCEFLGIHPSTLNSWKASSKIPFKRLGKRIFFNRSDVLNALKDSNYQKLRRLQQ